LIRAVVCAALVCGAAACGRNGATASSDASAASSSARRPTTPLKEAQLREAYAAGGAAFEKKESFEKQLDAVVAKAGPAQLTQESAAKTTRFWWAWGDGVNGPCLELSVAREPAEHKLAPTDRSKCGM
jgi:hypothetical protein